MNEQASEPTVQTAAPGPARAGKMLVAALVVIGTLLGFSLGLISSNSLRDSGSEAGTLYDQELVTSLFKAASPAVVEINITASAGPGGLPRTGSGSGFLVDHEGHIVTNQHVVAGATEVSVSLSDGRVLEATTLGSSAADDLAVIQVDSSEVSDIEPLGLADSAEVEPGQMAIAVGSPFRNFNSVSVGVVSGIGRGPASVLRRPIPDMIQTDAPLNAGNSGGPLLNSDGLVIGVNSSVRVSSLERVGDYRIGFAVPSNTVADLTPRLIALEQIRRPWLGISGGSVTRDLTPSLGLSEGVYITSVFPGSPAEQADLVPFRSLTGAGEGDVITAVDGRPVASVEDMVSYFNKLAPGDEVTLSLVRGGRPSDIEVTLAEWPDG